jgi:hypothetical protein
MYFFEYDRPGKKTPGRTRYRMEIEEAAQRHPTYRPIMNSLAIVKNCPSTEEESREAMGRDLSCPTPHMQKSGTR